MQKSMRILLIVAVALSVLSVSVAATAQPVSANECQSIDGPTITPMCSDDDDGGSGGGSGGGCLCPVSIEESEQLSSPITLG